MSAPRKPSTPVRALALIPALALLQALALPTASGAQAKPPLTVEQVLADGAFGRLVRQSAWTPDGRRLSYLWKDDAGEALWALDPATGAKELLLRPADLPAPAGSERFALDEYRWTPQGDALLLQAHGDLYLYTLAGRQLRRLTSTAEAENPESEPEFSPDGTRLAFVRDFDLHLLDLATGKETALTSDGQENEILNGVNDWIYWEEIWNRDATGYWWSPDGNRIAYYRFEEAGVETVPIAESGTAAGLDTSSYPRLIQQKYPKAGAANPRVRLGVLDLKSGKTTWLSTGGDPQDYLARVAWTADGRDLLVQHLNRDQTRLTLLRCRPAEGACSSLLTQEHSTWVNIGDDFRALSDGRFLWGSEDSGWRRLGLYEADGRKVRDLSPPGWAVSSLDGVTDDGWVIFTGYSTSELGPADRQILHARLDGSVIESITVKPGWHSALVAEKSGWWLQTWSDANTPPRQALRKPDGEEATAQLPSEPSRIDLGLDSKGAGGLPKWELLMIPGPDGSRLPVRMLKPAGFDSSRRYPVIVFHYGGPASQVVENRWDTRGRTAWHKLMGTRGFVVFSLDNLSSLFFGKAGEDRDYRRIGEANLAAQLAGVDYLKTLPWVDTARLGLWGWSGGGTNTLYCLLERPGVWRAGMAGAPVTDWRLYDSIWTERYLDRPQENAEGYRTSSPLTQAEKLGDRLLLIHGTADDNVHFQNSLLFSRRLIDAGIPFEQAYYPGEKHGLGSVASRHFYERMTEFFERTLDAQALTPVPSPDPPPTPPPHPRERGATTQKP